MHVLTELADGPKDVVDPRHRRIYFEGAQSTVVNLLRQAWTSKVPDEKLQTVGVQQTYDDWIRNDFKTSSAAQEMASPHAEVAGLERNPDKDQVDSAWRKHLLEQYAHLFYDIGNMIQEVNCQMGHYHPPAHDSLVLNYLSPAGVRGIVTIQRWDKNVLILPAFLDKGVSITASRFVDEKRDPVAAPAGDEGGEGVTSVTMGRFTENEDVTWFIRANMDVKFEVHVEDGDGDGVQRTGVAAVFAVGLLCLDPHGEPSLCKHEDLGAGAEQTATED
ncbi:hypothetical protein MAPG_02449 [Magnaporthiopsis poae ATCC 64411]|uniref:Uncharacterized protein n=1 Tax=Magnaporthiopsis poae (strain ATCC 64411 / 73-15) TaxID=644358 RepID=A0A0C4DRE2_MAGP6|nr:hypothetical protein MAPG_02449 [Magnaporthiopsis poae ATCC 64411]